MTKDDAARRHRMVEMSIARRGITDERVLASMRTVPRARFVAKGLAAHAYDDSALPIEAGQTISQPFIVASMVEAAELTPTSRVLEIGTGSGYGAAVLSRTAAEVWTIERHEVLAATAWQRLAELGYDNVYVISGDGTIGLAEQAPFDAIVVTAAAAEIPQALLDQLVDGGRLVIPIGADGDVQRLLRIRRRGVDFDEHDLGAVRFVPLIDDGPAQSATPP